MSMQKLLWFALALSLCGMRGKRNRIIAGSPHVHDYASLTISRGFLSSRIPTNFECRSRSPSVHSRNSITATSLGRTQTHFFIFSASKISPHRARSVSGRFTNARCEAQMHPKGKPCRYVLNPHNPIGAVNISCLPLCCV